jgi:hypothetical protein
LLHKYAPLCHEYVSLLYIFQSIYYLHPQSIHTPHYFLSPKLEVLVKAEHDFYREKWQKEKEQN